MLEVRLLGQFEVRQDGKLLAVSSRPAQTLLAYLLLNPGIGHRREQLAGVLAPDSAEENARGVLRHALWRLRKTLGADPLTGRDYLLVDELSIAFDANAHYWLDTAVVAEPLTTTPSIEHLAASLAVYAGDLLPGFYDDWVALARVRLEAIFEGKMRRLLEQQLAAACWAEAAESAERWIALGHSPEAAYCALMVAHAALGDRSRVASAYRRCVEDLHGGLGVEPSAATQQLYERLVKGEGAAGPARPVTFTLPERLASRLADDLPVPGKPPFKGLQHFEASDAGLFFGRAALTAALVNHLRRHNLLIVVGASGSGKSSLVRAGLLPALQRSELFAGGDGSLQDTRGWECHLITPSGHPLQALALALACDAQSVVPAAKLVDDLAADPRSLALHMARRTALAAAGDGGHGHVLLVIDQFEEVFTLCPHEEERVAFIANLLEAVPPDGRCGGPLTLILALRADFYAQCAGYPLLRQALEYAQHYIGTMGRDELRQAIVGPAEVGGWEIEPGLVDLIVRDAGDEPGALPLLSHALLETWRGRSGRTLTLKGYAAAGGVRGAIAKTADTIYARLDAGEQVVARRIFLRLTSLGDGMYETRRRAALSELWPDPEARSLVESVLHTLAAARLLTLSEGQVEVAHEALIREWPVLRRWLAEDRENLRLHHRLAEAAEAWEAAQHEPGELYRGVRLAQALEWAQAHRLEINRVERDFLAASQAAAEREAAEREAQQRRELEAAQQLAVTERARADEQQQAARKVRRYAAILGVALVLALVMAGLAVQMGSQTRRAAHETQSQRSLAFSRELAASALAGQQDDAERSLLLALRSVDVARAAGLTPPAESEVALHAALQAWRLDAEIRLDAPVVVSPDGVSAATLATDGALQVWDLATLQHRAEQTGNPRLTLPGGATIFAFSPEGARLAWADARGRVKLVNAVDGETALTLAGNPGGVSQLHFSADGSYLLSYGADLTARAWDLATGQQRIAFTRAPTSLNQVLISPDGRYIIAAGSDYNGYIVNTQTGAPPRSLIQTEEAVICGNTTRFVVNFADYVRFYDAASDSLLTTFNVVDSPVTALACSADGKRLATGGPGRTMRIWDTETGQQILSLNGREGNRRLEFTAAGDRLIVYQQGRVEWWDVSAGSAHLSLPTPGGSGALVISGDGALLAAGTGDAGQIAVWAMPPGTDSYAADLVGWGADTAAPRVQLLGHTDRVTAAAFSPIGRRLATGSLDRNVLVWDLRAETAAAATSITPTLMLPKDESPVIDVAFSPDGTRLATVAGSAVRVWDVSRGPPDAPIVTYIPRGGTYEAAPLAVAWNPRGGQLAVGLGGGIVHVVDAGNGTLLATLTGPRDLILDIAYSPDGARIATANANHTAQVWGMPPTAQSAERLAATQPFTLRGHAAGVTRIAFSPDGTRLVTGDLDGVIRFWDVATGRAILAFPGLADRITGLVFSPDGAFLAASGDAIHLYLLHLDDLVALARSRVTRELTPEECHQYLHVDTDSCGAALVQ